MKTTAALATLSLNFFLCIQSAHAVVTFDWATVGNPGNAGELSGNSAPDGYGPDAIVGGVDYTYRISKHEVTAGQYTEFLNAVAASDPYGLYSTAMWSANYGCKIEQSGTGGSYTYSVATDRENRPVNFVSYLDVMRFTNWLENGQGSGGTESGVYTIGSGLDEVRNPSATYFIPSEDEWYKAAYHKNDGVTGNYFDYPTSSDTAPINTVVNPDPGNNANFYDNYGTGTGTLSIGSPYYMTEVGEFENSESPYGTFDQGGNVWEWNEAIFYGPYHARGLRGGSFGDYVVVLHAANRSYNLILPSSEHIGVGFRVATVPEPGSATLLLCVGVGVLMQRRRR